MSPRRMPEFAPARPFITPRTDPMSTADSSPWFSCMAGTNQARASYGLESTKQE